ncbi:hypothetical protein NJ76_11110 [Rhodococcus sp. IITR03]|nr:hypothetical protein NJ76_11110 [Rhodococcus sp. IITR03]
MVGQQPAPFGASPGDGAVERERDRVEDRRLARARLAVQQEQPVGAELVEVDLDGVGERTEGRDLEVVQSHAGTSVRHCVSVSSPIPRRRSTSLNASSIQPRSRSDGSERTSVRNDAATSRSLRPRTLSR